MRRRRAVIGDVFEVSTASGFAYLQYTHEDAFMKSLVRVLPGRYETRPSDLDHLVSHHEAYFVFYLLDQALKDGLAQLVGNRPIPEAAQSLPLMRQPGEIMRDGRVLSWLVGYELPAKISKTVARLTSEDRKLSVRKLIGHLTLVEYLEWGWTPEREEEYREGARREAGAEGARQG
jgi:hypothetical protein